MGLSELFLEHRKTGKRARHLRITPKRKLFTIGNSRTADLRIAGEGVQGCHAVLMFKDSKWIVRNVSLEGADVLVNDKSVIEAPLNDKATLKIGDNVIDLLAREKSRPLFVSTDEAAKGTSGSSASLTMHQVVVSRGSKIIETHVLKASESYSFFDGERSHILPPPTSSAWKEVDFGSKAVRQRLVAEQAIESAEGFTFDQELKKPLLLAFGIFLLLLSTFLLMPKSNLPPQATLDQKSIDMIFNAEAIKKKRTEAKKVVQTAKARSGGTTDAMTESTQSMQPDVSQAPVKSAKATAALNSIRNAGLSALVGKIAKRASKNGIMVAAQGVSPDVKGAGRAFFNNGTSTTGGGGAAATAGDSYRLGGIATRGKGGGASGVRDGTALAGGTVGTGDVAMVDEETVIEGGLDRDVIADVIRRNLGQIRYCYERQLSSNPELYGKLLVRFTIDAGGTVLEPKIDTSTLKSAMIEGCVLRRLAGWKFPTPRGGTQVRVSYPFLFKALD